VTPYLGWFQTLGRTGFSLANAAAEGPPSPSPIAFQVLQWTFSGSLARPWYFGAWHVLSPATYYDPSLLETAQFLYRPR
jgi:hypothetical protein